MWRESEVFLTDQISNKSLRSKQLQNSLSLYIQSISDYPVLTREQMEALAKKYREGDAQALQLMVLCNTRLVIRIAKKMQGQSDCANVPLEDLIQYGNEGLVSACKNFDPQKGLFASYAGKYIRHTIRRCIDNYGSVVRYPVSFQERKKKVAASRQTLTQLLGREPTAEELVAHTGLTFAQVNEAKNFIMPLSTDIPIGDDDNTMISLVPDSRPETDDHFFRSDLREQLEDLMKDLLTDREINIVMLRTGMVDGQIHTLEEIGSHFGLSRERVRQIFDTSVRRLGASPQVLVDLAPYLPADREPDPKRQKKKI